ncbi:MAG: radical SAM protein [Candidatus Omnitrophota bacterium]
MKNKKKEFKYIYGPVSSWRLGRSLGIDPLSQKNKICGFDCVYCQVGRAKPDILRRKCFIKTQDIVDEIKEVFSTKNIQTDYITFSGRGEPTQAKNLGELITAVKKIRKEPVAVITNSSLLYRKDVRIQLAKADLVMAKLDADSAKTLFCINRPAKAIIFNRIISGLKKFKQEFNGKLALQIMFLKSNQNLAAKIAKIAKEIQPEEIQINTPLRKNPCKALSRAEIKKIELIFTGFNIVSVYKGKNKKIQPISSKSTLKRRGK